MLTSSKKKVGLILSNSISYQLYRMAIDCRGDYKVVAQRENYVYLRTMINRSRPDIVVIDLNDENQLERIDTINQVVRMAPYAKILVVSLSLDPQVIFTCLRAGVSGYILDSHNVHQEIINRMNELLGGGAPLSSEISKLVVQSFHQHYDPQLTHREVDVLKLLSEGHNYSAIADKLFISKETSKTHLKNIYRKLKVTSRAEAIAAGIRRRSMAPVNHITFRPVL